MFARVARQLIQRGTQFPGLFAGKNLLDPAAMLLQQLRGYEQLPPRCVERQATPAVCAMPCAKPAWRATCSIASECQPAIRAASENSTEEVSLM